MKNGSTWTLTSLSKLSRSIVTVPTSSVPTSESAQYRSLSMRCMTWLCKWDQMMVCWLSRTPQSTSISHMSTRHSQCSNLASVRSLQSAACSFYAFTAPRYSAEFRHTCKISWHLSKKALYRCLSSYFFSTTRLTLCISMRQALWRSHLQNLPCPSSSPDS